MRRVVAACVILGGLVLFGACAQFSSGNCADKATCGDDASVTGDTTLDAIPDVPFDSLIVPDVVPDGDCNGGAEDCTNGIDDNCNGLIDCADPVCANAGYLCTASPPSGWSGPVEFAEVTTGSVPGCAGAYTNDAVDGNGSLNVPASTCSCTCGPSMNEACPNATTSIYTDPSCGSPCSPPTISFAPGQCINFPCAVESEQTNAFATTGGICEVNLTKTIPTTSWTDTYRACSYTAPTDSPGGCVAASQCVAGTGATFMPKPCLYQVGTNTCPASYPTQTIVYKSIADTRDCSACTCAGPTGGFCNALINFFHATSCNTGFVFTGNLGDNVCEFAEAQSAPTASGQAEGTFSITDGTCASSPTSSPSPIGSAAGAMPITVCCQ